jgi:malonyl CoA-acyl carrier protein transacylase
MRRTRGHPNRARVKAWGQKRGVRPSFSIANVDASPIGIATAVRNALVRQVASPVRWVESVQKMVLMGVRRFVEIAPGNVLTGLVKGIDPAVELINVSDVPMKPEAWTSVLRTNRDSACHITQE